MQVQPPDLLMALIPFFLVAAVTAAIDIYVERRFKRSRKDRLTNEPTAPPFSSPAVAGTWTKGLLAATLILAVVAVISGIFQIELRSRLIRGNASDWSTPEGAESIRSMPTMEQVTQADSRQELIIILRGLLIIGTAVLFLIWFYRMHKNLPSLGQKGLVFTPEWAVGFFFVPIFNFFRPFQAMREIWHGSDPGRLALDVHSDGSRIRLRTPPLVGWWWALFLGYWSIAEFVDSLYSSASRTPSSPVLQTASILVVAANLLLIPSALVTIRLVGRLTEWQNEKARLRS